ncbi:MAG: hypothetical protein IPM54_03630 [Polyangiaceae bacterium]|nr:hypothetical protein [Polyangiaceae bacterium]
MTTEFFVVRIMVNSPWITSTRAAMVHVHEDPEFKTKWTEPLSPIDIDIDDETADTWPDVLGCGGKILGRYVSEHVLRDWDGAGIAYGKVWPAQVAKVVPGKLKNVPPPNYYWISGHIGAAIDFERSGYRVIGRSSHTGKTYVDHRVSAHRIVFVEGSWDGSDLFITDFPPTQFYCTRKVVELAAKMHRTNFRFVPIEEAGNASHPGI